MALQPATRRLLTEAAAAATYRTAAQTAADADARIAAMLTTQKAKPSGLASLGADGIVPAAQLPAPASAPLYAVLSNASVSPSTASASAATGLSLTLPAAGTYLIDVLAIGTSGFATYWRLFRDSTALSSVALAWVAPSGSTSFSLVAGQLASPAAAAADTSIGNVARSLQVSGQVVTSAAKTVYFDCASGGTASPLLYGGASLRAVRLA